MWWGSYNRTFRTTVDGMVARHDDMTLVHMYSGDGSFWLLSSSFLLSRNLGTRSSQKGEESQIGNGIVTVMQIHNRSAELALGASAQ
jgi:hypothetical protein